MTEVLRGAGMDVTSVTYATDDASAVRRALSQEGVDIVISTGGIGHGHGDHLVPALLRVNAEVLVRGVSMRPGHPTVLAHREDGVPALGLPGNPFAGLIALIALGLPLPAGLVGSPLPPMLPRVAARPSADPPSGARLVAVSECAEGIVPVERQGPAMTCGLVDADSIAVIETSGIDEGASARTLSLPLSR
ncbi:molybdopterin-binding protein [Frigoribacterium sp. PhB107]|uniref:molybdopterin-binding protein n=1 Tax=Frigoribacterium sp. PhB107 TaxID=2485172 RepID=UPI000F45F543